MYKDMDRKQDVGHFFCLMDISAFMDVSAFKKRVDGMIDEIKACRKRPNVEEILIPGENRYRTFLENRKLGIPLGDQTFKELEALCEEYKIPFKLKERGME
jgi:LDH2 family malate/lactate/ureidoglycolate dehydrogenase